MTFSPEMLNRALMQINSVGKPIKKIKVTSWFYYYLKWVCPPIELQESQDIKVILTGIPIEVDNTIDNYYEIVY